MQKLTAPLLLTLLAACIGPKPCLDACEEEKPFWEECMADDGTLCEGQLTRDCVDDPVTYQACLESDECDYGALFEDGVVHLCESPEDVIESCTTMFESRYQSESKAEWADTRSQCTGFQETEISAAMDALDCEAFCSVFRL